MNKTLVRQTIPVYLVKIRNETRKKEHRNSASMECMLEKEDSFSLKPERGDIN